MDAMLEAQGSGSDDDDDDDDDDDAASDECEKPAAAGATEKAPKAKFPDNFCLTTTPNDESDTAREPVEAKCEVAR
jgi:hypothetical protein